MFSNTLCDYVSLISRCKWPTVHCTRLCGLLQRGVYSSLFSLGSQKDVECAALQLELDNGPWNSCLSHVPAEAQLLRS